LVHGIHSPKEQLQILKGEEEKEKMRKKRKRKIIMLRKAMLYANLALNKTLDTG